jgi:hypothetical protein
MRNILLSVLKLFMAFTFTSCEDLIEVNVPKSKVESKVVFSDDVTATAAVTGIYVDMLESGSFANGGTPGILAMAGLSSDELRNFPKMDSDVMEFEDVSLLPKNNYVLGLWASLYKSIYQANAALEGLSASTGVSISAKNQLMGEAFFVRAFCHFYLTNLFGDVPLVTSSDYRTNALISRTPQINVYEQIIDDLLTAQSLLGDTYITSERVRPNKAVATALLARAYLYTENWSEAEIQASAIITDNANYTLAALNNVFLKNNTEAIWQLRPLVTGNNGYTSEAYIFSPESIVYNNVLNNSLINAFEVGDERIATWIGSYSHGSDILFYPAKYKQYLLNQPLSEYSMVLRLAEQHLIRSEARAQQDNLTGALEDLDIIRNRAGLPPLAQNSNPGIDQTDVLLAIERERRVELFTEWGHRWFDLKRTGRTNIILGTTKTFWAKEDELYPIPQSEFIKNPNLGNQNDGY